MKKTISTENLQLITSLKTLADPKAASEAKKMAKAQLGQFNAKSKTKDHTAILISDNCGTNL